MQDCCLFASAQVRFFLYPPHFERDGFLSIWYSSLSAPSLLRLLLVGDVVGGQGNRGCESGQLYEELQTHPWRTTSPEQASVFFLGIDALGQQCSSALTWVNIFRLILATCPNMCRAKPFQLVRTQFALLHLLRILLRKLQVSCAYLWPVPRSCFQSGLFVWPASGHVS